MTFVIRVSVHTFRESSPGSFELEKIVGLRNGTVLITGATGSGKFSTLAAVIDLINKQSRIYILTIEDPIEFWHPHQSCIVDQRELHNDTNSFQALRAALRLAPKEVSGEITA